MNRLVKYFFVVLMCISLRAHAREPLKLAVLTSSPPSVIVAEVLSEVYRQAGIPLVFVTMPGLRASSEANMGRIDGEVARVASYGTQHPNLIRITPSINTLKISAYFKKNLSPNIKTTEDLKKYSIGYVSGLKSSSELVGHLPKANAIRSSKALVQMLNSGRIEIIVNNESSTDFYINQLGLNDIERLELSREPLHHYLHQKHRALAPVISNIIERMSDSGELAKLVAKAENALMKNSSEPPE